MISFNTFLDCVQKNINRVNEYKLGMDGRNGQCDCIGLIIGAVRLAGEEWKWTHGSNYSARYRTRNQRRVTKASDLQLLELVYKAKEPGVSGWSLPATYSRHADQRDYYHVGVVTSISPLEITHCTSVAGGIKKDSSLGAWGYAGELDIIDYSSPQYKEEIPMGNEIIATYKVDGGRLALRSSPERKDNNFVRWIEDGDRVYGQKEPDNGWVYVEYSGKRGYCMMEYLKIVDSIVAPETPSIDEIQEPKEYVNIKMERQIALRLAKALEFALNDSQDYEVIPRDQ